MAKTFEGGYHHHHQTSTIDNNNFIGITRQHYSALRQHVNVNLYVLLVIVMTITLFIDNRYSYRIRRSSGECRGVPISVIKDLIGYSDITTKMIYAHLSPDINKAEIQKLPFGWCPKCP
jgi:hypothetical protein